MSDDGSARVIHTPKCIHCDRPYEGLMPEEERLRDLFADATTSSVGDPVKPVTVRDGDCYLLRAALDELEARRAAD